MGLKKTLVFVFILFFYNNNWAQQVSLKSDSLKLDSTLLIGLHKAKYNEINSFQDIIKDKTIPAYFSNGKKINEGEFLETYRTGEYGFTAYIDKNKIVKLLVLTPFTETQQKKLTYFLSKKIDGNILNGTFANTFSEKDILGNKIKLKELKGKIVVINFGLLAANPANWKIPALNDLVKKYKNKNVVFLGNDI